MGTWKLLFRLTLDVTVFEADRLWARSSNVNTIGCRLTQYQRPKSAVRHVRFVESIIMFPFQTQTRFFEHHIWHLTVSGPRKKNTIRVDVHYCAWYRTLEFHGTDQKARNGLPTRTVTTTTTSVLGIYVYIDVNTTRETETVW